ncbi:hypothetical protein INT45_013425 [Circinella minor]|uniref:F-box domain-containing protein n=1 Tax=Circinella minor TaxID=1195481 RepID=A0A8H7S8G5_9FUNG|nr:hypothetical protein INT45_013425 [Circinella minor]
MLYEGDDDGMSRDPSNNNVVQEFNLAYLCLNAVLHKDKRTAPILRRCPKLQCLMIANIEADSDFYKWPSEKSVDLNMFFQLCPLLQYIECNSWGTSRKQQEQWMERARRQKNQQQQEEKNYNKGLRELITREAAGYGSNEIIPTIQQHTSTLEILSLGEGVSTMTRQTANPSDWTQLERITQSLPQLHTFSCKYLQFGGRVLVGFLEKCPRLTELTLWCMLELPDDMLLVLNQLPHLTKLDLGIATTSSRPALPSETSWCWFFNQNNTLRHLCLRWGHFVTDSVVDAIGSIEHLEELQLVHTAKWATTMDTLRRLTHLKRLELWTVNAPLDSVLKDLYWLQDIQLIGCSEVSCHSLRELVDHPNGMLSKLRIQRCGSIQPRTLKYIENKLASRQQEQQRL